MTVRQLRERLASLPDEAPVFTAWQRLSTGAWQLNPAADIKHLGGEWCITFANMSWPHPTAKTVTASTPDKTDKALDVLSTMARTLEHLTNK